MKERFCTRKSKPKSRYSTTKSESRALSRLDDQMFEAHTKNALTAQEREFHKTFKTQMKVVEETLEQLQGEINQTIAREQADKKLQRIISERNFFRKQALFLNEQNNSEVTRAHTETEGDQGQTETNRAGKRPLQDSDSARERNEAVYYEQRRDQ
jgi:hypothetical protein